MERQLKKLQEDSYAVRREEGRPKHGQTSFAILGIGSVSWFVFALAIVLPKWRTNYLGMLGYPHSRSWGLFAVVGMESQSYHDYMGNTCRFYTQMAPMGVCITPICLWYRTKCMVSFQMLAACYATGFFFILVLIMHSLCLVWTMRMTPRLIRWAATWWVGEAILHIAILMFYVFMTSECFQSLDNESLYPEPAFNVCFYMECLVIMMIGTNAVLGMTLMKMWPESSSSSGSDDSSSVDSDGNPIDQGYPGGGPPGYPGGPPPGYPGGRPPQGRDPNIGYDPNMGGYDPNMGYGGPPPGHGPPPGYGGPPPGYGPPGGQWQG